MELQLQYQSFQNECSGLVSFRIDWFDLLAVLGTLKSLLEHHAKASILQHSAFFMVQLTSFSLVAFFPRKWTSFWTFPKDSKSTSSLRGLVEFSSKGPPAYWAFSFRSSLLGSETQLCP